MLTARALFDAPSRSRERAQAARPITRRAGSTSPASACGPGTGAPLDSWRARQMWGVFNEGLAHAKSEPGRLAWWIAWRRIAGGCRRASRTDLRPPRASCCCRPRKQQKKLTEVKPTKQELAEMWRAVASLERLSARVEDQARRRAGAPAGRARKGREDALHCGRSAGSARACRCTGRSTRWCRRARSREWLASSLALDWPEPDKAAFPLAQLGRRTGDRARDLDDDAARQRSPRALRAMPGGERAGRAWSSRSSRSRRARSASRSATRCPPACAW